MSVIAERCPGLNRHLQAIVGGSGEAFMVDSVRYEGEGQSLPNALLAPSGLFGDAVDSIVDRY